MRKTAGTALAAVAMVLATAAPGPAVTHAAAAPYSSDQSVPFEPVVIQKITLPSSITEASTPVFTSDGHHLLFFSALHLWIVADDGTGLTCLSCGVANEPTVVQAEQEGFATEFPDGKRVFFGAAGSLAVLECAPSLVQCTTKQILPVDLSAVRPTAMVTPGGGSGVQPTVNLANGSSPKLAPDGVHVAFSDIRTDAAELMTIATLTRGTTSYTASDAHVLNPVGPTGLTDTDTDAWSDAAALFEFKSFGDGGAYGTYVQVGGEASLNPDVWKVDFATGVRTRLTAQADWDEDDAPSPDGRSILVESDRTMHRVDEFGGLVPFRGFIDAPKVAIAAGYFVDSAAARQCDLQPWLYPAAGDEGGNLMGEPIQPYTGGDVHAANNVSGFPQWSPDGTEIALNTESYTTNASAPYLLVAHLVSRKPTTPLPVVSSEPGAWAPAPADYHGTIDTDGAVVLNGKAAGTATVVYANLAGVVGGSDTVSYDNYSDDGIDTVNGTDSIDYPTINSGPIVLATNLTLTGRDSGTVTTQLVFTGSSAGQPMVTGTTTATLNGYTVTGPPVVPQDCPDSLPKPPPLALTTTLSGTSLLAHVTASVKGAGLAENQTDTRPVTDATVTVDGVTATTDDAGDAVLRVAGLTGTQTVTATAGDTLVPASASVAFPSVVGGVATTAPVTGSLASTGGTPALAGLVLLGLGTAVRGRRLRRR